MFLQGFCWWLVSGFSIRKTIATMAGASDEKPCLCSSEPLVDGSAMNHSYHSYATSKGESQCFLFADDSYFPLSQLIW